MAGSRSGSRLVAAVAIGGGGGASSGGIALAAAACLGACALAGVAAAGGVRSWAPPPRRVIVYVAALAAVGLVSYASIAWSLTPQASCGDANRWLVAAAAAAARHAARGTAAPPTRGRRVGAVRRLAAAHRVRHPAARARRVLPDLAATAGRARLSQRDRRLRGARGARARCGSRARRSARRRVAGCGYAVAARARPGALLVARRRAGRGDRLRGLAGRLRPAHRERRGAARRARRDRAGGSLGARPALLQGARRALHGPRRLAPGLVRRRGRARLRACSARWPWSSRSSPARACAAPAASRCWSSRRSASLLAAVRLSSRYGGPSGALSHVWHQLSGGGAVGSTDHLTQLSTNLRGRWWGEAWDGFTAHPWRGNGADTFETIDRLARPDFQQAGQEHSAFLHVLSGTGLLGAIPAAIALAAAGACRRRSRACAEPSAPPRSRSRPASARSRCTTRSTGSGSRPR